MLKLVDTHCHLNFKAFAGDYLGVAKRAQQSGIEAVIVPGSNVETSQEAIEVCRKINENFGKKWAFAAVGIHPIHVDDGTNFAEIEKLARLPEVVAIGESGVDRFHPVRNLAISNGASETDEEVIEAQKQLFKRHLDLALEVDKPIIVHNREADADILEVLDSCGFSHDREKNHKLPRMEFHCFSSDWKFAQKVLALGANISFTGNITYGNKSLRRVIERVPLDRVMVQTDAPYLIPEPLRSQGVARCEPAHVIEVARKIAEVRGANLENISKQLLANSNIFFNIFNIQFNIQK